MGSLIRLCRPQIAVVVRNSMSKVFFVAFLFCVILAVGTGEIVDDHKNEGGEAAATNNQAEPVQPLSILHRVARQAEEKVKPKPVINKTTNVKKKDSKAKRSKGRKGMKGKKVGKEKKGKRPKSSKKGKADKKGKRRQKSKKQNEKKKGGKIRKPKR